MGHTLLTKTFFHENPLQRGAAAETATFLIKYEELCKLGREFSEETLSKEKLEEMRAEAETISSLTAPKDIIRYLRKNIYTFNKDILFKKVFENEDEILPLLFEKWLTSSVDVLIENAVCIFSRADANYCAPILRRYNEFRDIYARSMACIVLGFRSDERIIAWLYDEYFRTKEQCCEEYPMENFEQAPLIALYTLNDRFYGKK